MKLASLDYATAHEVVERNKFLSWDGWDIVTWRKDPRGYSDRRGKFMNNAWGILFRYTVQPNGTWRVPENYVNFK